MQKRNYTIEPSDYARWSQQFLHNCRLIEPVFKDNLIQIEHVGSTSVPGLDGKPTLDMLVLVKDIQLVDQLNDTMLSLGFEPLGEYVAPGGRLFKQDKDDARILNIHVYEPSHDKAVEILAMRDYLNKHPVDALEYAELKKKLFAEFPNDYFSYRSRKDTFLKKLKEKALI